MKTQNINNMLFDKEFREQLRSDPQQIAKKIYNESSDNVEYKVFTNSKDTTYLVFHDQTLINGLNKVNAAATAGTGGSIGTVATAGTIDSITSSISTASSVSCASTGGSIGSVDIGSGAITGLINKGK